LPIIVANSPPSKDSASVANVAGRGLALIPLRIEANHHTKITAMSCSKRLRFIYGKTECAIILAAHTILAILRDSA